MFKDITLKDIIFFMMIILGCEAIGYIIMPVFSDALQYYTTAFALNTVFVYMILSNRRR